MKKTFSFSFLILMFLPFMPAQSGGGTNFNENIERIEVRAEQLAEKMEAKAEKTAEKWEQRAKRWEARAGQVADRLEARWENDWSANFDFGRNRKLSLSKCPEISFLGIETHEISVEKAKKLGFENRFGSYVSRVMAKSAAESAGLQAFDYIYGVDEQRTSNNQSLSDILEDFQTGDEVTLYFVRKGQKMNVNVKLASVSGRGRKWRARRPFLGVSPTEDDFETELDGVSVDVVEKSTAAEMGLKIGDVITSINGYPILDWDDVTTAIQNTKPGQAIEVNFKRDERELSAKGTIKAYEEVYPEGREGSWNLDIDWNETGDVTISNGDDWENKSYDEQDENRAFIGIFTEMISKQKAQRLGFDNPYGIYVTGIIPNSGAEQAGLKAFDYIFGFDEYRAGEQQDLGLIMKKYAPGDKATVHYYRKGKKATASIVFTKPIKAKKDEQSDCEDGFFGIIQLANGEDDGVAISPVPNSTATELGLKEGDVITQINGYPMLDWQDITTAIGMLKPGEAIHIDYERNGNALKGSKPLKSLAQTKNCPNCDCSGEPPVSIATMPSSPIWNGWPKEPTTPRMNIGDAKISMNNLSDEESSSLRSKGVHLAENNSLNVESLKVSPNTASGMFILEFNLPTSGNTLVRIYNLTGRVLYEYDMGSFSGKFSDSVDISQNGPGSYFLEITQNGKAFTKKIALSKN